MAHGRPVAPVVLSDTVRLEREAMTRFRSLSHALVRRARIILLAARPRDPVHFTPTDASGLNQVDIWFNLITQQAIRRGSFRSVKDFGDRSTDFVTKDTAHGHPLVWIATADSILQKLRRLCEAVAGTRY